MAMTLRFYDGADWCDAGDQARLWTSGTSLAVGTSSPATRHGVGQWFKSNTLSQNIPPGSFATDSGYNYVMVGSAIYLSSASQYDVFKTSGAQGGLDHLLIQIDGGDMAVRAGGSGGTSHDTTASVTTSAWHHLILASKWGATTGQLRCWWDNTLVLTLDNIDTDNTSTQDGFGYVAPCTDGQANCFLDDFWIAADNSIGGNLKDERPSSDGDLIIRWAAVDADGTTNDFTPQGAGDNYVEVDDPAASGQDDDTTYNESSTVGHIDLFGHEDAAADISTLLEVAIMPTAKNQDSGSPEFRAVLREGETNYESSGPMATAYTLGQTYRTYFFPWANKGAGGAWDKTTFNADEIGYKRQT
jgi:hypothetical protein